MQYKLKKSHKQKSVGPWAKQKLDALQRYLEAYMKVMQNQRFKLFYIDAFAGAGVFSVRAVGAKAAPFSASPLFSDEIPAEDIAEITEYIAGSPLRALSLNRRFDHYRFVELDPNRVADLNRLAEQFPESDVKVHEGEANDRVQFIASHFNSPDWRGVAFLDPYGAHLHWKTLEALARTKKFDVVINFPLGMTINRLVTRDEDIRETWQRQLDLCFGCPDWRDISYESEPSLFGDVRAKKDDAASHLLKLYVDRLEGLFGFVSTPSLVRNTKGSPLYYLIWAGSNHRGKPIANHILGLGERVVISNKDASKKGNNDV